MDLSMYNQYIKRALWRLWAFLRKLMSDLVSNASAQREPRLRAAQPLAQNKRNPKP